MSTEATPKASAEAAPMRKFLFDHSFDDAAVVHRVERKPVLMKPEQIDTLKKECYDSGFTAGTVAGKEAQTEQFTAMLARVEKNLSTLIQCLGALAEEQEGQIRQLVLAIAKKILPQFTAQHGVQEIEALLTDTIREMAREPRLVVRVSEAEYETLSEKIQEIATRRAYPGKVIVMADAEVASGDCRVEWPDGGIERDTPATWNAIEQTILPSS